MEALFSIENFRLYLSTLICLTPGKREGSERESASLQKYAGVFNGQYFEYSVIVGDIKNLDVLKKGDFGYVISRLEP